MDSTLIWNDLVFAPPSTEDVDGDMLMQHLACELSINKDGEGLLDESFKTAPCYTPRSPLGIPILASPPDQHQQSIDTQCSVLYNGEGDFGPPASNSGRFLDSNNSDQFLSGKSDENSLAFLSDSSAFEQQKRRQEADQLANAATQLARGGDPTKLQLAIEYLTQAIILNPSCVGYYFNRSLCFYRSENYPLALNDINIALQFEPASPKYLTRKAWSLFRLQRYAEAEQVRGLLAKIDPANRSAAELDKVLDEQRKDKALPTAVDDPVVGVIIANLPKNVNSRTVRDLVGSRGIGVEHPIFFIIENNSCFSDTTSAIILLLDIKETAKAVQLLNNFPFGVNFLQVKALYKSVYVDLKLSTEVHTSPYPSSAGNGSSDEADDREMYLGLNQNKFNFEDLSRQIHWQINPQSEESPSPRTDSPRIFAKPAWGVKGSPALPVDPGHVEPSNPKTVFIGNIPPDTEPEQLKQLIRDNVGQSPMVSTFQIAKKAEWDYAFINCVLASDAKLIHDVLQKARFSGCILDVNYYDNQRQASSTSSNNAGGDALPKKKTKAAVVPQNCNSTNVYVGNLPVSLEFHEFFVAIYPIVSRVAGSDFALYRQSPWRHCFFNFPNSAKAIAANSCLNGLEIGGATLASNMAEGRAKFMASSKFANVAEFELSLDRPSTVLRIDNVDGALSNADIKVLFPELKEFWRDYPTAYIRFSDERVAAAVLKRAQGYLVRNAALVACYVNKKKP